MDNPHLYSSATKESLISSSIVMVLLFLSMTLASNVQAHAHWRVTSHFQDRTLFQETISALDSAHRDIDGLAINPNGDWILISGTDVWASAGFNNTVETAVKNYVASGHTVKAADCSETSACIVIYENWGLHKVGTIPQNLKDTLTTYQNNGWEVRDVEMTANGFVLLGPGSIASYAGVDNDLKAAIYDRRASKRKIRQVEVGFNGEWALLADHNPMYENVHSTIVSRLDNIGKGHRRFDTFLIGEGSNYVAYSGGNYSPSTNTAIDAIEFKLGDSGDTNIWTRMDELNVSGASIAIIEPGINNPRVRIARGYGRKKSDEHKPVLAKTAFKLASLSKYLGGLAVLDQLEGDFLTNLDDDITTVCTGCQLDSWRDIGESIFGSLFGIPNSNLGNGITLRRLLSHTAGINNFSHRFGQSSWAEGDSQTSLSWLLGMTCSNGECDPLGQQSTWRTMPAGGQSQYSNGGFLVAQAYLEDQDDSTIDNIIEDRLFATIGMPNSSAKLNLGSSFLNNVAWQHSSTAPRAELVQSVARLAGGVWSSSADYAEAMIVALNEGRNSSGTPVLSEASTIVMLTSQPISTYGFGVDFDSTVSETNDQDFFHNGANNNRVYTYMCGNPTRDQGIAILLNTESSDARALAKEIYEAYVDDVGWPSSRTCD